MISSQLFRHVGRVATHRVGLGVALQLQHLQQARRAKRRPPGQQRVQHSAQAVQVAAMRDGPAVGLLGRHELGGSQHAAAGRHARAAEQLGDAEVGKLDFARGRQQQVGGLHVAMDHAAVVGVLQRAAGLNAVVDRLAPGRSDVRPAARPRGCGRSTNSIA